MVIPPELLEDYRAHGWFLFPLHTPGKGGCSCGQRACDRAGKHPRTAHGLKDASDDPAVLAAWWQRWPAANVGLATEPSGLVVVDIDAEHGGERTWAELLQKYGKRLERTLGVRTGGGGRHLYYLAPDEPIASRVAALGEGIDVRGRGGYVVAPPSLHRSGKRYRWLATGLEPVPLPDALRELLLAPASPSRPAGQTGASRPGGQAIIPEGQRNETLYQRAAGMYQLGVPQGGILDALRHLNRLACRPPLGDEELRRIAANAVRYGGDASRSHGLAGVGQAATRQNGTHTAVERHSAPGTASAAGTGRQTQRVPRNQPTEGNTGRQATLTEDHNSLPYTDTVNAEWLVARHGADLRYCSDWKRWLIWDGTSWQRDRHGAIFLRAKETARAMRREGLAMPEGDRRTELLKQAARAEHEARRRAMVGIAAGEPGIPIDDAELDADPMLLCCANGTVDLRTGRLRPHRREDLITRMAPVTYDPAATAPRWHAFLDRVMGGNREMIAYLQRAAGYSLTGDTGEEVLFVLHGSGRNGKSRFLGAVRGAMGEYARTTRAETLMVRDGGGIPNDVAALAGRRMVISSEVEDGNRLAESLIKLLTGGDEVSARFLHGEFFEFVPSFKLWLATNHRPRVKGTDTGIWARIHLIPFAVTIPPEERDHRLKERLQAEAPGILRWMVEGCLAWQREGLKPPAQVRAATEDYRKEMDVLAGFLGDRFRLDEGGVVTAASLYDSYRGWCEQNGERPWTQKTLGVRLRERGLVNAKGSRGVRVWEGITECGA